MIYVLRVNTKNRGMHSIMLECVALSTRIKLKLSVFAAIIADLNLPDICMNDCMYPWLFIKGKMTVRAFGIG